MDVIGNASHAKVFAAGIAGYGGKIAVERGRIEESRSGARSLVLKTI